MQIFSPSRLTFLPLFCDSHAVISQHGEISLTVPLSLLTASAPSPLHRPSTLFLPLLVACPRSYSSFSRVTLDRLILKPIGPLLPSFSLHDTRSAAELSSLALSETGPGGLSPVRFRPPSFFFFSDRLCCSFHAPFNSRVLRTAVQSLSRNAPPLLSAFRFIHFCFFFLPPSKPLKRNDFPPRRIPFLANRSPPLVITLICCDLDLKTKMHPLIHPFSRFSMSLHLFFSPSPEQVFPQ